MALGLPVISTNVGGIKNLLIENKTGVLVNKNDINDMTIKILQLIEGKIDGKMISLNARKKVESLDINNIIPIWIKLIRDVLNE